MQEIFFLKWCIKESIIGVGHMIKSCRLKPCHLLCDWFQTEWNNLAVAITIILVIENEVKILQQDAATSWSTINHYWYQYNCTCLFYQLFIKQPSLHVCSQQEWFSRLLHILFKSQVFKLQIIHTLVIANTVLNFKFFKI